MTKLEKKEQEKISSANKNEIDEKEPKEKKVTPITNIN